MEPIEMIAEFTQEGVVKPIRFRKKDRTVINVGRIEKQDLNNLCGNKMCVFHCSSLINGHEIKYEIRYEIGTMKWMLFI